MNLYHTPVLLRTSVEYLITDVTATYVDVTYGGGGHSRAILQSLNENGRLFSFDRDTVAFNQNPILDERLTLIDADFKHIQKMLKLHNQHQVQGIIGDLGVSSYQFDTPQRGFSIRYDAELDMRMDQKQSLTAQEIINTYKEEQLMQIVELYGEITNARELAQAIVRARQYKAIKRVEELKNILQPFIYANESKYLAQVFQALRIEVNCELQSLQSLLLQGSQLLAAGGRMVIISYHSLEDRLVKNFFKNGNFNDAPNKDEFGNLTHPIPMRPITKKAIIPDVKEQKQNPRSRSAKLRAAIKL